MNKKYLTFLIIISASILLLPVISDAAIEGGPKKSYSQTSYGSNKKQVSCFDSVESFENSNIALTKEQSERISTCKAFCEKSPPLDYVNKLCGSDECKVQAASGKVSDWCCRMMRSWDNKKQAKVNPFGALRNACAAKEPETNYMDCISGFKGTGYTSDACCTQLPKIIGFDSDTGKRIGQYCNVKRAAAICQAEASKGKRSRSCCELMKTNHGKLEGLEFFQGNSRIARFIDSRDNNCDNAGQDADLIDTQLDVCLDEYKAKKRFNQDCCVAFYNGSLIPSANNMVYNDLDRYCNPLNYDPSKAKGDPTKLMKVRDQLNKIQKQK